MVEIPEDMYKRAEQVFADVDFRAEDVPQAVGFIAAALLAERALQREEDARIAEEHSDGDPHSDYAGAAEDIAAAIRSQTTTV